MQQIADWLKQLGISEYAERFVESDIDTSVLRDLTDQDLKDLVSRSGIGGRFACNCGASRCRSDLPAACVYGAEDPRPRRAPPSHGDVLRLCGLNGTVGAHGP